MGRRKRDSQTKKGDHGFFCSCDQLTRWKGKLPIFFALPVHSFPLKNLAPKNSFASIFCRYVKENPPGLTKEEGKRGETAGGGGGGGGAPIFIRETIFGSGFLSVKK